jgi:transcriptional regulator with XRE-family HTH domain
LGFDTIENSTSVPWRDAFPEFVANEPGTCLAGARNKKGFTQVALSELTGIPRRHISEMENGKRPIGKMTANKLAEVLDVDYRVFL